MKRTPALLVVLLAAGFVLAQDPARRPLEYRFDEVKGKVLRSPGGDEARAVRVAAGDLAEAGDGVRTGLFGRTLLSVPERAVRFEVFSSTRVRLAGPEPGVLLILESGRLKAAFDAFTGASEERRVAAPGALLAVRGTRYGLEASPEGVSTLAVFEGTVEVFPSDGAASLHVAAGEFCAFGAKSPPRKGRMERSGMSEKSWGSRGSGMTEGQPGGQGPGSPQGPADPGSQGRRPSSGGRG
ncbi:MAG: hypothetical protein KJ062_09880 [Thermoanaerobaculia bacterium]|nr:hypothetical protein [Thermoanaerobaculia bacterium]